MPCSSPAHGARAEHHGQGQNRTADTMIFSHVLYQLSYLAETKNPLEPCGKSGKLLEKSVLPALRSRPYLRAPRIRNCPENQTLHSVHSLDGP